MEKNMEEKTIVSLVIGGLGLTLTTASYAVYMIFGPGGDGVIFGSVVGTIGMIVGGIIGFKFGSGGESEPASTPVLPTS